MGTGTNCISSSVVCMHLYVYNATFSRCLRVSIFPSFLSLPMVLCLSVPSGRSSRLSRAVFRTLLLICRPLFYNSFSHLAACRSFVYRRRERILAVSRDEETTFRESLDSLSRPLPVFLFPFFPVKSPAKYPHGRREKEVHDLRTDRIKWGNLARRILERKYKDEGTTAG